LTCQTTCKAAFNHREESNAKYGIERAETLSEPWTSTSPSVDSLEYLVSYTETIIGKRSREFGSALDEEPVRFGGAEEESRPTQGAGNDLHSGQAVQREFKEQLCELAAALFIAFEERMRYLATYVFCPLFSRLACRSGSCWRAGIIFTSSLLGCLRRVSPTTTARP
jgi:hypothetical protein